MNSGGFALRAVRLERSGRLLLSIDELALPAGSFLAVLGPNGAGKTTLLEMLCGLRLPGAGQVLLDNRDLRRIGPCDRRTADRRRAG